VWITEHWWLSGKRRTLLQQPTRDERSGDIRTAAGRDLVPVASVVATPVALPLLASVILVSTVAIPLVIVAVTPIAVISVPVVPPIITAGIVAPVAISVFPVALTVALRRAASGS